MKRRTNVPSPVDSLFTQVEQIQQTDSTVEDGEIVWCRSTQCLWVYRVNSGLTPNGTDVVGSLYGNGVWVRSSLTLGAAGDLLQTTWFVDPTNGSDANSGLTSATALKTDAERQRRWGQSVRLVAPTTVTYLSSPPASDKVNFDVTYLDGAGLVVQGTPTITNANITLTAVTTLDRATQTPWDVTGVGLGATDVARQIVINAGARAGNYASVAKDLGGGKVRTTPFCTLNIAQIATLGACFTGVTPLAGDVVDVFTVPTLTIGSIVVRSGTTAAPTATTNCVLFDSIALDGTTSGALSMMGTIQSIGAEVLYRKTQLANLRIAGTGGQWMAGGICAGNIGVQGIASINGAPFFQFMGFQVVSGKVFTVHPGATAMLGGDCLFQNASLFVVGVCYGEFVSIFDRSASDLALNVLPGGVYRSRAITSTDLLWGDANAGHGAKVISGGALVYTTKPTINTPQGAGRQSLIGGVNVDWAAVPAVTAANNAMIVVEA